MIQHILSVFVVVPKFYDKYFSILDVLVFKSYNYVLRQTCSLQYYLCGLLHVEIKLLNDVAICVSVYCILYVKSRSKNSTVY
jgi:hypothetical protein